MSINLDYAERLADLHIKYEALEKTELSHQSNAVRDLYYEARVVIVEEINKIQSRFLPTTRL